MKITYLIRQLSTDESGATAIEYGLIAAFVGIVLVGALTQLGTGLNGIMQTVAGVIGG
jgi:pilus assembly protein Flp/PilA